MYRTSRCKLFRRTKRLHTEPLEPRLPLHGLSLPSVATSHLTLSFAQDGVDIAGETNTLFTSFNEKFGSEEAWQTTIFSAAQAWIEHIDLDVGVVDESGNHEFGTAGARSSDDRFGDIRIGARSLGDETVAVAIEQSSVVAGTWAGDIIFNSSLLLVDDLDALYSVTLHEFGHVLGLDHSDNPDSPMHIHGVSDATILQPDDIDQAIARFGTPRPDDYERSRGNDDFRQASRLRLNAASRQDPGSAPSVAHANLDTNDDIDFYRISMPFGYRGDVTLELSTSGISLLDAEMTVFSADGTQLSHASSLGSHQDLRISLSDNLLNGDGYIRITSSDASPFDTGAYTLVVRYDDLSATDEDALDELARARRQSYLDEDAVESFFSSDRRSFRDDNPANNEPSGANGFDRLRVSSESRNLTAVGTLSDADDLDHYRFIVPRILQQTSQQAYLSIRSLDVGQLIPSVSLITDRQEVVPLTTLINGNGELLVVAQNLESDRAYTIAVGNDGAIESFQSGNYELSLSLSPDVIEFERFVEATIQSGVQQTHQLYVATSQLFHFALTVDGHDLRTGLQLQIVDESGKVAHKLVAPQGTTRTAGSVLLAPGAYRVIATALDPRASIAANGGVRFSLDGSVISEPLGIDPVESDDVEYKCPSVESIYCYPSGTESTVPHDWDELLIFIGESDWTGGDIDQSLLLSWWNARLQSASTPLETSTSHDDYSVSVNEILVVPANEGVLANDQSESEIVIASPTVLPKHGDLTIDYDGGFIYTPQVDYVGVDWFEYVASDLFNESASTRVVLNVGVEPLAGDVDGDQQVTASDIDSLTYRLNHSTATTDDDLNEDGSVDGDDREFLVSRLLGTQYGDANLDGAFDSIDLVMIFQQGKYAIESQETVGWAAGDWNGDEKFDSADLTLAFQDGYTE